MTARLVSTSLLTAFCLTAASGSSAQSINEATYRQCLGKAACVIDSATISARPVPNAILSEQTLLNLNGLGVAFTEVGDPRRRPEIQGDPIGNLRESIVIDFSVPSVVNVIQIGHLQNPDEFPTDAQETAIIEATGLLGSATLEIQNLSNTGGLGTGGYRTNSLSLFSSLVRLSTDTGEFRIEDPFASLGPLTRLTFIAPDSPTDNSALGIANDNSDFSLTFLKSTTVPAPTPISLNAVLYLILQD